ncbi:hypothetical protein FHG64_06395 [Antarcticibacterium flavum]|uniref:Uncharacterized protein n=1 Tax=Antarcticibacterium flavum TaxID=2058175 RepID=A0A5B7X1T6_9FLAO|nr:MULTISPECIES: hypothetical protein [Antarcticibacterium]MCM4161278.1 hypothetical protein [Antarcticibacterium sp. W02-3]QCY69065.1 hypothetical protein FHG64_06395 [Antarcticibacterium flavum]
MRNFKTFVCTILFSLSITIFSYSQSDSLSQILKNRDTISLTEAQAYKMLYENQINSNTAILSTIFYALGGLGAAVLLVFGSTWWFNEKKVKDLLNNLEDKATDIKNENHTEIKENINQLSAETFNDFNEFKRALENEIKEKINELKKVSTKSKKELKDENQVAITNYQNLLKSYNENLQSQIENYKKQFEANVNLINKELKGINQENKKQLKFHSNQFKRDILKHNAEIAALKGNSNIALMAYLDYSIFLFDSNNHFTFKYVYKDIINCLNKVEFIYTDELEGLNTLTKVAEEEYPKESKQIKELYKELEVRKL